MICAMSWTTLPEDEVMENLNFLFAAYSAVWVLLFFYILVLSRRNRSLEKEIEELRELLRTRKG